MQQACIFILYGHVSGIQITRPCICRIIVRARPIVFVRQQHAVTAPKCTQHFIDLVTVSIHDHHLSGRRQEPFCIIFHTVTIKREGFIATAASAAGAPSTPFEFVPFRASRIQACIFFPGETGVHFAQHLCRKARQSFYQDRPNRSWKTSQLHNTLVPQ